MPATGTGPACAVHATASKGSTMTRNWTRKLGAAWVAGAAVALLVTACGQQSAATAAGLSTADTALSIAYASATASGGTLLCTPSQDQLDACTTLAEGDACSLTLADGTTTIAGTCRATVDGAAVACAPNPPAPPQELVDACAGLALGGACTVTEPFGGTRTGVCVTARDGATVVCGRVHVPPQGAIDACAALAAGDACTMPDRMGTGTVAGTCSLGPAESGPLACTPSHQLLPHGAEACIGLAEGDACTMGRHGMGATGTCVTPAAGTTAICVVACRSLGGRFHCGPRSGPGGHPGGPMGR